MMDALTPSADLRGFADPVRNAQAVFRAILAAMSQPGVPVPLSLRLPSAPLPLTLAAAALTLFDYETPILLCGKFDNEAVFRYLAFHAGAARASTPFHAAFIIAESIPDIPWDDLSVGTSEYPDRSATVLLPVTTFQSGTSVILRGPGIERTQHFCALELNDTFWQQAIMNASRFPLGIDFLFCGPEGIAALPRSTVPAFKSVR